jgi:hypothetical protein
MAKYLIIQADESCGRGARGLNLHRFLSIFHGRRAVRMVSTRQLLDSKPLTAETLFVGLPSRLDERHLDNVRYDRAVLFDYHDCAGPAWSDSNRELLLSLTDQYLKPWVEPEWDFGLRMGVLPIRRHRRLKLYLQIRELQRRAWRGGDEREYDVAFLGGATALANRYHQRIEWLREVKAAGDRYSFWGGIVVRNRERAALRGQLGERTDLYYPHGRAGFLNYFANLSRSRAALAPAGNARWTYRHYEAIYAGAIVVSTDFRDIRTLIPLPLDAMIHVPDNASVLPAIDEALAIRRRKPELAEENIRFLEQYLQHGDYSRDKPELMERFLAQLTEKRADGRTGRWRDGGAARRKVGVLR